MKNLLALAKANPAVRRVLATFISLALALAASGAIAQVSGTVLVGGVTPVVGTCTAGYFMYNNSGLLGCQAGGTTSISFPQAVTGGTSGGIPYFSAATTLSASAALTADAIVVGGGAGAAPFTITTGAGVVTALGLATNATGGVATIATSSPTANGCVEWSSGGLVVLTSPCGSGGGSLVVGTTAVSGGTNGYVLYDDSGTLGNEVITPNGTVGFPAVRRITTGTTDSASTSDSTIVIALGSEVNFSETLPACVSGINGQTITVKDENGQAGSFPITVKATTSTVDTISGSSGLIMNANFQSISFQCDSAATDGNWMAE